MISEVAAFCKCETSQGRINLLALLQVQLDWGPQIPNTVIMIIVALFIRGPSGG